AGAAVTLLPRSALFLEKLEAAKRTSRNSMNDYRAAAPAIQTVKAAYEKELWESGAVDLVMGTVVAPDGRFSVENLPAGDWVLFVTSSVATDKKVVEKKPTKKERGVYVPGTHLTGYQRLTVWLREITVSGGRTENVELIGGGAGFSGGAARRGPRTPGARPAPGVEARSLIPNHFFSVGFAAAVVGSIWMATAVIL